MGFYYAGLALPAVNVSAAGKTGQKKVLVVYFSATGTTKSAAKKVKKATDGTLYQIKAAKPYTSDDLSYGNDDCRANTEQQDGSVRPNGGYALLFCLCWGVVYHTCLNP